MSEDPKKDQASTQKKSGTREDGSGGDFIRKVRRKTRRRYTSEEKIRIVMEGLRGELSVADLCRREGIHSNVYYKWLKDFMEAGKARLSGDTRRDASKDEVDGFKRENARLKEVVAELAVENHGLKKIVS